MPVPILKGKLLRRAVPTTIRAVDEKSRSITFVASDETVDRFGDVIRVSGWKLENFRKNPVFLWSHMSDSLPIGRVTDVRMELEPVPVLLAKVQFTDEFDFADICFRLYKGGFLNAVSVGLMIDEWNPRPIEPGDDFMPGWEITSQELVELSAVPVPANPNALARTLAGGVVDGRLDGNKVFQAMCLQAIEKGIVTEQEVGVLGKQANGMVVLLDSAVGADFKDVGCNMPELPAPVAVKELADPGLDPVPVVAPVAKAAQVAAPVADPVAAPAAQMNKRVVSYRKEPLAPEGTEWDAAAELGAADEPEQWERMCTVVDGDPENKGSYKLPHHLRPSKGYATVKAAIGNALARFNQTDMPESDRAGAKAHLLKHQAEFEEKAFAPVDTAEPVKETESEKDARIDATVEGLVKLAAEIRQAFTELAEAIKACVIQTKSVEVSALAAVAPAVPAGVEGKTGTQEPPIPVQAVGQPRDQKAIVGDILARLTNTPKQ